jgi:signal transduction histidine kinase
MCISVVEREADKLSERAGRNLTDATRLVRELSQEVRTMSHLLHPPLLDEAGLESALHWFVEGFAQRSGINVDLDLSPELGASPRKWKFPSFASCRNRFPMCTAIPEAKRRRCGWDAMLRK